MGEVWQQLQVTVNANTYSGQQAQKLRSRPGVYTISEIGDTLVLSSLISRLWVEWHKEGTVQIGVSQETGFLSTL